MNRTVELGGWILVAVLAAFGVARHVHATSGPCSMRIGLDLRTGVTHLLSACNVGSDCYDDGSTMHQCVQLVSNAGGPAQGGYSCFCPGGIHSSNDPCMKRFLQSQSNATIGVADCVVNNCVPPTCQDRWEVELDPEVAILQCPCP